MDFFTIELFTKPFETDDLNEVVNLGKKYQEMGNKVIMGSCYN